MVAKEDRKESFEVVKALHGSDTIAYMAGFVDGEGCISSYVYEDKKDGRAHIFSRITVSNTRKDVLEYCQSVLGGKVRFVKCKSIGNSKDKYVLTICERDSVWKALTILLPYLIVKYDVAELVLHLIESKPFRKNIFTMQDFVIVQEIRELNKRGRGGVKIS